MLPNLRRPKTNVANFIFSFDRNSFTRIKLAFFVFFSFFAVWAQSQTISVTSATPNEICFSSSPTGSIDVAYTITGSFSGNTFTAQLSNDNFVSNIVSIGTLVSDVAGTIVVTIPANTAAGSYTIRVIGSSPSTISGNTVSFTVTAAPTAIAGTDISICSTTSGAINITAGSSATNTALVTWTSDGTGTLNNIHSLTLATYTPGAGETGNVTLTLTAAGNGACADATSTKAFTITAAPTAVAGTDVSTCSNSGAVNIIAGSSATNTSLVTWTSDGTGTLNFIHSLTGATYTPGASETGSVTLTLTATGNSPCGDATSTKTLTINVPPTATYSKTPVSSCGGGADGSITVTASGGTVPYQFNVDGGAFSSNNVLTGLTAANHTVVVQDAVGCTFTIPGITVLTAGPLGVGILNKTNVSSCGVGSSDGSITVFRIGGVFDGVTAIQYSITAGPVTRPLQTSNVFSNLPAGTYTVNVIDSKGCPGSHSGVTLTQAAAVNVALAYTRDASSCVGNDGSITVTATGGVPPYDYKLGGVTQLTTSLSGHTYSGLAAGSYMVTVTDSKGCTSSPLGVSVSQATSPVASVPYKGNATCIGGNDGFITVGVTGGVAPYSYSKDGGINFQSSYRFLGLVAGTYDIVVKDFRGCTSNTVSVTIKDGTVPCLIAGTTTNSSLSVNKTTTNGIKVNVFPNPSRSDFTILLESKSEEPVQLKVISMYGKTVHLVSGSATQEYRFGTNFASGMYLLQVTQGKATATVKLVKGN